MKNYTYQLLKEKEISSDYHLKRVMIYLLAISFSSFITSFLVIILGRFFPNYWVLDVRVGEWIGIAIGIVLLFILMGFAIYHSTNFWKFHKEYQELVTSILTKIDIREEKRE